MASVQKFKSFGSVLFSVYHPCDRFTT